VTHTRAFAPLGWLFLLAACGCGLRIATAEWQLSRGTATLPDSELYWGYAESIYLGRDYRAGDGGARRTPGYPAFVALCWKLAGRPAPEFPPQPADVRPVLFGQALLGGFGVWIVGRLAMGMTAEKRLPAGSWLGAAVLTAVDPFALSLAGMALSETVFLFGMIVAVRLLWQGTRPNARRSTTTCFIGGAIAGTAVLVRPSGLLLAPMTLLMPNNRLGRAAILLGLLAALSPWWVRNAAVYGRFVPTTTNTGESLYDGLNPNADGGSNMKFIDEYRPDRPPNQSRIERELADDDYWRRAAVAWARANPGQAIALMGEKLRRFWSPWPNAAEFRSPVVTVLCGVFGVAAYLSAILGLIVLVRSGNVGTALFALTPVVYFMLLHAVFVSSVRYRTPAMPLVYLLAGAGAAALWGTWRSRAVRHA
jgi:hypothetical protein